MACAHPAESLLGRHPAAQRSPTDSYSRELGGQNPCCPAAQLAPTWKGLSRPMAICTRRRWPSAQQGGRVMMDPCTGQQRGLPCENNALDASNDCLAGLHGENGVHAMPCCLHPQTLHCMEGPRITSVRPGKQTAPDTRCMRQVGSMSSTSIRRSRRAGSMPGRLLSIWDAGISPCAAWDVGCRHQARAPSHAARAAGVGQARVHHTTAAHCHTTC